MKHGELTESVIGAAYAVYNELGSGFLESVYERSLAILLAEQGLNCVWQAPIDVHFHGHVVGEFRADLLVESNVIVELKAVETLNKAHEVQLVNYLAATGKDVGLLINFGPTGVDIKRKVRQLNRHPVDPVHPENPIQN
ncbi:MAG: GxxExxY protein [Planctomycetota bacterium]